MGSLRHPTEFPSGYLANSVVGAVAEDKATLATSGLLQCREIQGMASRDSQALFPSSGSPAPWSLTGSESQATAPALLQTWTADGVLPERDLARGSGNHTVEEALTWRKGAPRTGILVSFLPKITQAPRMGPMCGSYSVRLYGMNK